MHPDSEPGNHDGRTLVLVVDDEPRVRSLIPLALDKAEFEVVTAAGGEEGLAKAAESRPDVVLLDILMPGMDGIEVMRQLREQSSVPIILLTAKASTADKTSGLDLGADDYIAKPFHPDELAARIRAVLRRTRTATTGPRLICFDDVEIDLERRIVRRDGDVVQFSRTEWALLQHLASNANRVLLYPELLTKAYGAEYADDFQYLRVWISRIRRKLGAPKGEQGRIRTYAGVGYLLDTSATASDGGRRGGASGGASRN